MKLCKMSFTINFNTSNCSKYLNILYVLVFVFGSYCFGGISTVTEHQIKDIISSNKLVLAYIRPTEMCDERCENSKNVLAYVSQATLMMGIKVIDVQSSRLLKAFEPNEGARLFFYRNEVPLLYEAESLVMEDVVDWLTVNQEAVMKKLNEDDFEHLTQASTGATTGDWFILFYGSQCEHLIPIWETLAVRLNQHKVVAAVNTDLNKNLKKRFDISKCPTALFFRSGKMYEYILPNFDMNTLMNFAEGWYQNAPSKVVPPIQTPFDKMTDDIAQWLKPNPLIISILMGIIFLCFLLILCVARLFKKSKPKLY